MDRGLLAGAWRQYYDGLPENKRVGAAQEHILALRGRMLEMARRPERLYHGFDKRRLTGVLGMALGIHQQTLHRLTTAPHSARMLGGGGA